MSIINDALKKTQMSFKKSPKKEKEKEKDEEPKAEAPRREEKKPADMTNVYDKLYKSREEKSQTAAAESVKPGGPKRAPAGPGGLGKAVFATVFFAAAVAFSYKFLSGYEPLQDFIRSKTGKHLSSRHLIKKYVPTKKKVYKPGDLVLNGISVIDGETVALINDEIYQTGDTVNNKTVTKITKDQVELQDDEQIYTLTVR